MAEVRSRYWRTYDQERHDIKRRLLDASHLALRNLANSKIKAKDEATVDVLCGICIFAIAV